MWLILSNPTSGGGKGSKYLRIIKEYLDSNDLPYRDITSTSYELAAGALNRSLNQDGSDISGVYVIGGDGMVHLAVQELANRDIPLALIPAGTGNDFARSLNLPLDDPLQLLETYATTSPTHLDLGLVNNKIFADILSTGFDSVVNERANRMRVIKGRMKYNIAILLELSTFKPKNYEFRVDSVSFTTKAMLIAVSNGISYGGGMKVTPNAELDDGLFDIMVLGPVSKIEFLKVFPKVFSGGHISHPAVKIIRGKEVSITSDAVAYADGERIGNLPIKAKVLPRALLTWRL
jgi:diacylglycerol kinase (ATP)